MVWHVYQLPGGEGLSLTISLTNRPRRHPSKIVRPLSSRCEIETGRQASGLDRSGRQAATGRHRCRDDERDVGVTDRAGGWPVSRQALRGNPVRPAAPSDVDPSVLGEVLGAPAHGAIDSPIPPPRKAAVRSTVVLDGIRGLIDAMLVADLSAPCTSGYAVSTTLRCRTRTSRSTCTNCARRYSRRRRRATPPEQVAGSCPVPSAPAGAPIAISRSCRTTTADSALTGHGWVPATIPDTPPLALVPGVTGAVPAARRGGRGFAGWAQIRGRPPRLLFSSELSSPRPERGVPPCVAPGVGPGAAWPRPVAPRPPEVAPRTAPRMRSKIGMTSRPFGSLQVGRWNAGRAFAPSHRFPNGQSANAYQWTGC